MIETTAINREETTAPGERIYSLAQPVWHVLVMSLFTFAAYLPYWFYKTWRDLRSQARQDSSAPETLAKFAACRPILRAITVVIPVFNLLAIASLFRDIALLYPDQDSPVRSGSMQIGLVFALLMTAFWFLGRADGPCFLLFNLVAVPVAAAQYLLNRFWRSRESADALVRHAFSPLEIIVIIIGALYLGLVVTGFSVISP